MKYRQHRMARNNTWDNTGCITNATLKSNIKIPSPPPRRPRPPRIPNPPCSRPVDGVVEGRPHRRRAAGGNEWGRRGEVRYGAIRCNSHTVRIGRCCTIQYNTRRYGTIRYETGRYGMIGYDRVRYGAIRCGRVRQGTIGYDRVR